MIQLAAPPPPSRTQLAIQRPPSVLDSSDEARTDTSTSPAMNPARTPGSDTKSSSGVAAAKTPAATPSSSSNSRRRKADAATEDKPAAKQRKYERKTKRFIWPDDLHRLFVAAIFDGAWATRNCPLWGRIADAACFLVVWDTASRSQERVPQGSARSTTCSSPLKFSAHNVVC
jgi:hypothetical protein